MGLQLEQVGPADQERLIQAYRQGVQRALVSVGLAFGLEPVGPQVSTTQPELAGLLWAVSDGCDAAEAARRAAAVGTAAAMQEGTGVGDRQLVDELMAAIVVRPLPGRAPARV